MTTGHLSSYSSSSR